MDWNLQDTSCWIRAETLLLYITVFFALPFYQLEILKKSISFIFTNATRKRLSNFWARSNFCDNARGCFRKCFSYFLKFSSWKFALTFYLSYQTVVCLSNYAEILAENVKICRMKGVAQAKPGKTADLHAVSGSN